MKKRLFQSLTLGLFLLIIFQVAKSNRHYGFKTQSPRAGVMAFTYEYTPIVTAEKHDVPVVAESEVPEIETTWLYAKYTKKLGYGDEKFYSDINLLNKIVSAEAGNQSELGKRLVIDVVLNRINSNHWRDDDTIWEVITHPGQFETYSNGAYTRVDLDESINDLIVSELRNRTDVNVIYFRTKYYFSGVPELRKEGDHYFSGEGNW